MYDVLQYSKNLDFMGSNGSSSVVLDTAQLQRIEATHRGFLYQHLYGVACLLMVRPLRWSRLLVELDEDLELHVEDRYIYVQVKTRSGFVQPSDIRSAMERFEQYRAEHESQRRFGRSEFVLALNREPSPALAARYAAGDIPEDVKILWPGHTHTDLPPLWADTEEAFAWCVEQAAALPFVMVAPDVLVLKLAGIMMRVASGTSDFSSHAITSAQADGMLEQFVHQFHEFPATPLSYRPQDNEPSLITEAPIRLIVGFSGAGKTSWAAQSALASERATYFDVADLPSSAVSSRLKKYLPASISRKSSTS